MSSPHLTPHLTPTSPPLIKLSKLDPRLLMLLLFLVGFIGAITPGPDILLVLNNTLRRGVRAGMISLAGIATGWLVFLSIIYFGLAHVLSGPLAQGALSLLGGGYLCYLAYLLARAKEDESLEFAAPSIHADSAPAATAGPDTSAAGSAPKSEYLRGLIINLSNPKAILFFSIIIAPQMGGGNGAVAASIGWLFLSLCCGFLCVICVAAFFRRFVSSRVFFIIDKVCAALFAAFAVSLFFNAYECAKIFFQGQI